MFQPEKLGKNKSIQIGKKQGKLSLLYDDMLLFVENYKFNSIKAIRIK